MELFKQLLQNPWSASVVVFFTQILMLYFRTINIVYTTKHNIWGAVISNNGVAITWLLSMTIGMNSMLSGQIQPIIGFLLGGTLGTIWGLRREIRHKKTDKIDFKSYNIGEKK